MVNWLNTWAQRIIIVVIICTIIEMILPEGKNKKYIKIVMGIYVVFTIISPIIAKINNKEKIDLEKYLDVNVSNETIETSATVDTNKYIEELYKEKLKEDVKEKLLSINYETKNVNLEIETKNDNTYGSILSLEVTVSKEKEEKSENTIRINKVTIGENNRDKADLTKEEIDKIKKCLAENYKIDEEKISVK